MKAGRPFELTQEELEMRIDEMVTATMSDLSSEFLIMPSGAQFITYANFQSAYETLKKSTVEFANLTTENVHSAMRENSLVFGVLRSVLGMTAPEWAELARMELGSDITQGAARLIDKDCRNTDYYINLIRRNSAVKTMHALIH